MWDLLLLDCKVATMVPGAAAIEDAAVAIHGRKLVYVGPQSALPGRPRDLARELRHLEGAWVTPGLIDCHTHLVFAGDRAKEWQQRAEGTSYEEIAAAGGGVLSTVRATRLASENELSETATGRALRLVREGVTTVEIKSGYGLDTETELKLLRAAARAGEKASVSVCRTFLGAHALSPDCDRAAFLDLLCEEMIPAVAREKLAEAVDGFCETIAFSPAEMERVFAVAKAYGLERKIHTGQWSDCGGAELAARYGALSAAHLEFIGEAGIVALARAGTVAVLLPATFYFLRNTQKPPVEAFRQAGVAMAVATDCNPGTAPVVSILTAMTMACTLFGLTPQEALAGATRNAAKALGLSAATGTLEPGKIADLAVWNIADPAELSYWIGADLLEDRYWHGRSDKYGLAH
jgi:imidazolonepropionase